MEFFEIARETGRKSPLDARFATAEPEPRDSAGDADDVFTAYLRTLRPGEGGDDEGADAFPPCWEALRRLVRAELRRRGLWAGPPRFVGVPGGEVWKRESLDELSADCLVHLLERVETLLRHLDEKETLEGLVRLEVRHFVHERQRRADPLGHRLYGIVHEAVCRSLDGGGLRVRPSPESGDGSLDRRITNETVLEAGSGERAKALEIEAVTRRWADELLPDLVTGWGKRRAAVVRRLTDRLDHLGEEGIAACRFKDLVDAVKRSARARWRWAYAFEKEGEADTAADAAGPDLSFEEREGFEALVACVSDEVERVDDLGRRSREHLANLWHFLRTRVPEAPADATPSRRRVAAALGIPRSLLPDLYARLGRLVDACRATGYRSTEPGEEDSR